MLQFQFNKKGGELWCPKAFDISKPLCHPLPVQIRLLLSTNNQYNPKYQKTNQNKCAQTINTSIRIIYTHFIRYTCSTSHLPKISNLLITRQQPNPFRHRQWLISWSSDHASECGRKVIYSYRITKLDNIGFVKHCMVWWVLISVSTFGQCDQNLLKIKYKPPHITSSGCWWCFNGVMG